MQSSNPQTQKVNRRHVWLKVSRLEFLPANSASLIIGLAWGLTLPVANVFGGLVAPLALGFAVIFLVSLFAAQINTMADYQLDQNDETKKDLVLAMTKIGKGKLKKLMVFELLLSLALILLLTYIEVKLLFVFIWAAAVFLAYAYSAAPVRLKSRSIAAPLTLVVVLSILPVTFVTYTFTSTLDWLFWLFLTGQAITVYAVIVPAEIRDYFNDRAAGTVTMTVQLGLVKASSLGLALLSLGGALCATSFILKLTGTSLPTLGVLLVVMAAAYIYVSSKYWKLLNLSRQLHYSAKPTLVEQEIVDLAAKNPKWIIMVTQAIVFMCLILLVAKIV